MRSTNREFSAARRAAAARSIVQRALERIFHVRMIAVSEYPIHSSIPVVAVFRQTALTLSAGPRSVQAGAGAGVVEIAARRPGGANRRATSSPTVMAMSAEQQQMRQSNRFCDTGTVFRPFNERGRVGERCRRVGLGKGAVERVGAARLPRSTAVGTRRHRPACRSRRSSAGAFRDNRRDRSGFSARSAMRLVWRRPSAWAWLTRKPPQSTDRRDGFIQRVTF